MPPTPTMILASIIILFSVLALGLLALLDRYDSAMIKEQADRRLSRARKLVYYDAFGDRYEQSRATPSRGQGDDGRAV